MTTFKFIKTPHLNNDSEKEHQRAIGMGIKDGWRTTGELQLSSQLHPICYWQAMSKESAEESIIDPCRRIKTSRGEITRQTMLAIDEVFNVADVCLLFDVLGTHGPRSPRHVTNEIEKLLYHGCLEVLERIVWSRSFRVMRKVG